jgi:hypothetical protein
MGASAKAGAAYFAIVFLAGFALGAVRTLVVAPRLGEMVAVLLEAPLILTVSWFVAAWCLARFAVPAAPLARLAMGGVSFTLLVVAELGVSMLVFRRPASQLLASYQSAAGAVGLGAQVAFAWIPLALTWRSWDALTVVRAAHTVIYVVMASATFVVFYAGISGGSGGWLWLAAALVGVESAVFLGSGFKCPLTAVATKYGASGGADTFLPERITRHTFQVFGPLILLGVVLLGVRWLELGGCARWLWRC